MKSDKRAYTHDDDLLVCDDCKREDATVKEVFCPYQEDVFGKKVKVNLCPGCIRERVMEI